MTMYTLEANPGEPGSVGRPYARCTRCGHPKSIPGPVPVYYWICEICFFKMTLEKEPQSK